MYFIKKYDMKKFALFLMVVIALWGCETDSSDIDKKVREVASAFAEAYFNYDFEEALKWVTDDSEKWLRFAATNISQEDVDSLNAQMKAATVEADEVSYIDDETLTVGITVKDFLLKDTVGKPGHIENEAKYNLTIVKQGRKFRVRMACLPQNERRSHD